MKRRVLKPSAMKYFVRNIRYFFDNQSINFLTLYWSQNEILYVNFPWSVIGSIKQPLLINHLIYFKSFGKASEKKILLQLLRLKIRLHFLFSIDQTESFAVFVVFSYKILWESTFHYNSVINCAEHANKTERFESS